MTAYEPLDDERLTARADGALAHLAELRDADPPIEGGRLLSYVYDPGLPALAEATRRATALAHGVNGLDPTAFGSVRVVEREILDTVGEWFHAVPGEVFGTVTSGGTESCTLAVLAASRIRGRTGIVAPTTVHPAFRKSAELFGMTLVEIPVDPDTGAVRAGAVIDAVDDDTALVVLSAPNYPFGTVDPIVEVCDGLTAHGVEVDVHVDACVGGLVLPFWPDGALTSTDWDFRVPQVTSLSADLHKYGFAPKGASTLFLRGRSRHRAGWFACTGWPGYPVVNPTLLGTRAFGGPAGAWVALRTLGEEGFRALSARTAVASEHLVRRIPPGLRLIGGLAGPLLAFAADDELPPDRRVHPHLFADELTARGFAVQCQLELRQPDGSILPPSVHLSVTPVTLDLVGDLSAEMRAVADDVRGLPDPVPPPELADIAADLARGELHEADLMGLHEDEVHELVAQLIDGEAGNSDARMAPLLAGVAALPRRVADRLLSAYLAAITEA